MIFIVIFSSKYNRIYKQIFIIKINKKINTIFTSIITKWKNVNTINEKDPLLAVNLFLKHDHNRYIL